MSRSRRRPSTSVRIWARRHGAMLLGVAAVLPLVAIDPAAIALLFNAEMLVAMGAVGSAMLRGDLRHLWRRVADSADVAMIRGGIALTRQEPRSILTWVGP